MIELYKIENKLIAKASCECNAWVATAIIGAGALGAAATAFGASKAANAQESVAQTAANTSLSMYNTTRNDLAPFRDVGTGAAKNISDNLSAYTTLPSFTAPDVVNDTNAPGYDFTLTQGLKAVQNSAAARGLGSSGAALKGAATFATGLANSTYGDVYNRALQGYTTNINTNQTAYSRLKGLVDTGETAATGGGVIGQSAANTAAGAQIGAGNAAAAGYNAIGSSVSNVGNTVAGYQIAKGLYGNNNASPGQPSYYMPVGDYNMPVYGNP